MLSILIPVYNYDISSLVHEIHKQATKANITFEIICFNDGSIKYNDENNSSIDSLLHTKIINSEKNVGRVNARQILSNKALYDWLLFLDADVLPKSNHFIAHYLNNINSSYDVFYGGFAYINTKPNNSSILRWKYGKKFEEVDAAKRNLNPHQLIISANFFIKKTIFNKINSKIERKSYGLDNYFAALLKQNNINVLHLNNEVYHYGLETSNIYLNKTKECIVTLLWLFNNDKMLSHNNKLLFTFVLLKKIKLNYLMMFFYKAFNSKMKVNLTGFTPNIYLLQLYKLSYICYKDLN